MVKRVFIFLFSVYALFSYETALAGGLQINGLSVDDLGGTGTGIGIGSSIDISQNADCDGDISTNDTEPFGDTLLTVKLMSRVNRTLFPRAVKVSLKDGNGRVLRFSRVPLLEGLLSPKGTLNLRFFLTKASNGSKSFKVGGEPISFEGFRNISIEVNLRDSFKRNYKVRGRGVVSIGAFDRC